MTVTISRTYAVFCHELRSIMHTEHSVSSQKQRNSYQDTAVLVGMPRALLEDMARSSITGRKIGQGSKWIRPTTRLAIYLRDGCACVYCGHAVEDGERLTLDHVRPCVHGGGNDVTNLVTCCSHCNSARGSRPLRTWCRAVAEYTQQDACEIERRVRRHSRRALPRDEAREMIARRG